ncbi:MAG: phosphoadenosine phosphosulfate reductase family protein [Candidatus Margulisbacteria bacterium]|nr:phosphoadenosine phosphosulfate reductase family protein [Candidatus Margulisiibacteriota bacterium]
MKKIRHVLGISGGKDSTALAIFLKQKFPELDIEYYFCDTGEELNETYQIIENLEVYLGKKIIRLKAAADTHHSPFEYYLKMYNGFLPSANARWCTKNLKLIPFEQFVADDPVVSYVGIREDENREAYISKKKNIQSIFPFRKNIWSVDVIRHVLSESQENYMLELYRDHLNMNQFIKVENIIKRPMSFDFNFEKKLLTLLECGLIEFNNVVFALLKNTPYPLGRLESFPLLSKTETFGIQDVFNSLKDSGIGLPEYYKKIPISSCSLEGVYNRSRSGCYFCFFQQKIEWVWLYEQHPSLFQKALSFEKEGYSWMDNERLEELIKPERIRQIKNDYLKKNNNLKYSSPFLLDILQEDDEVKACAACAI